MIEGGDTNEEVVFENDLWHVHHLGKPHGVAGWMMLIAKQHVAGPWAFDDRQGASLGPTIRHIGAALLDITGALRIYTAWMGESWPHFHAHLIPRYSEMPKDAKGWGVFDLQRAAGAGEIEVDLADVAAKTRAPRDRLRASPPPA